MVKWEYKVIEIQKGCQYWIESAAERELNALGIEGWELMAVIGGRGIFKRMDPHQRRRDCCP